MVTLALDTNVLVYAAGVIGAPDDAAKAAAATALLARLSGHIVVLPPQALGEMYNVITRKQGVPRLEARDTVNDWRKGYQVLPTTTAIIADALVLATDHQLRIWDAIILASAASVGCELLLSEDMHPGFAWRGCTVANPFAASLDPRLAALLG